MSGIVKKVSKAAVGLADPFGIGREALGIGQQQGGVSDNYYGIQSPLGDVTVRQTAAGPRVTYGQTDADVQRQALISQGLGSLSLDPTQAQEAYYQQATRQLIPEQERQMERLESTLVGRGIGLGSEQYERALENLRTQQSGQLEDIQRRAIFEGQDLLGQQIGNIGALAGQRDILQLMGRGAGVESQIGQRRQESLAEQARKDQQDAQMLQQLGQLAGLAAFASDERLKENLEKVGTLHNGLTVYVGNYNDKAIEIDSSLDKRPQLFLIAQEVQKVHPEAVIEKDGYLAVNYGEAVK